MSGKKSIAHFFFAASHTQWRRTPWHKWPSSGQSEWCGFIRAHRNFLRLWVWTSGKGSSRDSGLFFSVGVSGNLRKRCHGKLCRGGRNLCEADISPKLWVTYFVHGGAAGRRRRGTFWKASNQWRGRKIRIRFPLGGLQGNIEGCIAWREYSSRFRQALW